MTQPQQHCDHECVCPDYKASHSENGEDECYGDPDPCSLSCYHRSHPYQSERDCPVCGGGLMRHFWCIDRDCGWDSIKEVRELRQAGSP